MSVYEIANWTILPGLLGDGPIPQHFHVGHPTPWSEGLVVRFENADGTHWVGNFQCGSWSRIEIVPWPEAASILVNAGGLAYLINADEPTEYGVVGAWDTLTAFNSERTMMFVATRNNVQAYDCDRQLAWATNGLAGLAGLVVSLTAAEDSLIVEIEEEMGEPLVTLRLSPHDGSVVGMEYSRFLLLLQPWKALAAGSRFATFLEQELGREFAANDPLRVRTAVCIAKNSTTDDVLYQLDDDTFVEVHLTFPKSLPERPGWPKRRTFGTLSEWALASMIPEHEAHFGLR